MPGCAPLEEGTNQQGICPVGVDGTARGQRGDSRAGHDRKRHRLRDGHLLAMRTGRWPDKVRTVWPSRAWSATARFQRRRFIGQLSTLKCGPRAKACLHRTGSTRRERHRRRIDGDRGRAADMRPGSIWHPTRRGRGRRPRAETQAQAGRAQSLGRTLERRQCRGNMASRFEGSALRQKESQ